MIRHQLVFLCLLSTLFSAEPAPVPATTASPYRVLLPISPETQLVNPAVIPYFCPVLYVLREKPDVLLEKSPPGWTIGDAVRLYLYQPETAHLADPTLVAQRQRAQPAYQAIRSAQLYTVRFAPTADKKNWEAWVLPQQVTSYLLTAYRNRDVYVIGTKTIEQTSKPLKDIQLNLQRFVEKTIPVHLYGLPIGFDIDATFTAFSSAVKPEQGNDIFHPQKVEQQNAELIAKMQANYQTAYNKTLQNHQSRQNLTGEFQPIPGAQTYTDVAALRLARARENQTQNFPSLETQMQQQREENQRKGLTQEQVIRNIHRSDLNGIMLQYNLTVPQVIQRILATPELVAALRKQGHEPEAYLKTLLQP